jgi:hypothetical protein
MTSGLLKTQASAVRQAWVVYLGAFNASGDSDVDALYAGMVVKSFV